MRLLKFILRSNLFISLCAWAFLMASSLLMREPAPPISHQLIVATATFWVYNLNLFLLELAGSSPGSGRLRWYRLHNLPLGILLLLALLVGAYTFFELKLSEQAWFLQLGIVSVLYTLPNFFSRPRGWQLRSIPLLKVFLIAYVWTGMAVGVPVLHYDLNVHDYWLPALASFLFILAITLPFDIRDYHTDKRFRLLTVPGWLGLQATRWAAILCLLAYGVLLFDLVDEPIYLLIVLLPTAYLILRATPMRPWWYFIGMMDATILLHAISLYLSVH